MCRHTPERIAYLGDTVADVRTVVNAREQRPNLPWISFGVAPPHVRQSGDGRFRYETALRDAGADHILPSTTALLTLL